MDANDGSILCKMDPHARVWDVESQVRMILNQPIPEHYGGKLIPWRTGNGPTTWHSITEMPERPKPVTSSCPRVNAEDQSPVVLRPCEETHGNKLAAQIDQEGEPNGKRTMEGPKFNQNQEPEKVRAPPETTETTSPSFQAGLAHTRDIQDMFVSTARMIRKSVRQELAAGNNLEDWSPQAGEPGFMAKLMRVLDGMEGCREEKPEQKGEPEGRG
jgi:hypothetical protein